MDFTFQSRWSFKLSLVFRSGKDETFHLLGGKGGQRVWDEFLRNLRAGSFWCKQSGKLSKGHKSAQYHSTVWERSNTLAIVGVRANKKCSIHNSRKVECYCFVWMIMGERWEFFWRWALSCVVLLRILIFFLFLFFLDIRFVWLLYKYIFIYTEASFF